MEVTLKYDCRYSEKEAGFLIKSIESKDDINSLLDFCKIRIIKNNKERWVVPEGMSEKLYTLIVLKAIQLGVGVNH